MAKLSELKTLIEARRSAQARSSGTTDKAAAPAEPSRKPPQHAAPKRPPGRRPLPAGEQPHDDLRLAEVFADVERLRVPKRAPVATVPPAPIPRQRIADEQEALLASKYGLDPSPQRWDIGQELEGEQTYLRRGLGTDVLSKLRRGFWSLQGELDLHGATSDEARDLLAEFLLAARGRGARCVRVIHGKGLTSPGGEPVLKAKVRRWLAQWDDVLAYCEAPRHAGGGGAVIILLRGR